MFIYGGMGYINWMINSKMIGEDLCPQTVVQYTILRDKKYFKNLILNKASVNTIWSSLNLIEGSRRANIYCQNEQNFVLIMLCILLNL